MTNESALAALGSKVVWRWSDRSAAGQRGQAWWWRAVQGAAGCQAAAAPAGEVVAVVMLWVVLFAGKFIVLEVAALGFGGRVSLGGFFSVTRVDPCPAALTGGCSPPAQSPRQPADRPG